MNLLIRHFDTLASTNTEALDQARRGADEGLCIVAGHQSAGRGRLGREWVSPAGAGIFFSIVLRPKIETRFLPLLTLLGAVAVSDALRELYGLEPDIKWPNDVLVGEKKISGILAETAETAKGLAVIVGIGINLDSANFPANLQETAAAVASLSGTTPDSSKTLEFVLKRIAALYDQLHGTDGAETIRREWTARSSYAADKNVRAKLGNETLFGTTRGIEENGALRIETASGEVRSVQAGDVELVRKL